MHYNKTCGYKAVVYICFPACLNLEPYSTTNKLNTCRQVHASTVLVWLTSKLYLLFYNSLFVFPVIYFMFFPYPFLVEKAATILTSSLET